MDTPPDSGVRILLIEDEDILADLLKRKLEETGYRVEVARDGLSGLSAIRTHAPDLVLLDMLLPKLNGMEILKALNEEGIIPELPVVIISNSGQPVELELGKKLGARDALVKLNFDPEEIIAKVKLLLRDTPKANGSVSSEVQGESGANAPEKSGNSSAREDPAADSRILIVEDDQFLSRLLTRAFDKDRVQVEVVPDVEQARRALGAKRFDLICLDAVLPGEDGFAFLKKLKESPEHGGIPVILLSNLGQKEDQERGLSLGAADYLIKAAHNPDEIVTRVTSLLKK